jgi:CRP-like cAMP-binding protein
MQIGDPTPVRIEADADIHREGDRPQACCLLLGGQACRYRVAAGGERQLLLSHVSGDTVDLQSLYLPVMDHNVTTLVPSQAAFIAHQVLHELARQHPRLGAALWRNTLIDAAIC